MNYQFLYADFMKKVLLSLLLFVSPFALANSDQLKISTVEKIYREFLKSDSGNQIIKKYADSSLKAAFKQAEKYEERTGYVCLDYDVVIDAQDYEISNLVIKSTGNNRVIASFNNLGKPTKVTYTLSCDAKRCKVSNVGNLKQQLLKCR